MGIFDFFKSKKEEPKKEKISFDEIEDWLKDKRSQNKEKERRAIEAISLSLNELVHELKAEHEILGKIDLKERKAEERVKLIVLENLSNYSEYLEKLTENLEKLEKDNFEKLIQNIDRLFLDFRKKSSISYEKATFLIGKELGNVKDSIGKFFKELNEILAENKELILFSKAASSIENKILEIKKEEKSRIELIDEAKDIENKTAQLEAESSSLKNKIEEIKKSSAYLSLEEEKKQAKTKKDELAKEITRLREIVDFKSLGKKFHSDAKKMKIIQDYEIDFNKIIEEGAESKVLHLLDDGEKKKASEMIKEINKERKVIQAIMNRKDGLDEVAAEIIRTISDIKSLRSEKLREEKKMQKADENMKAIKELIQKELLAINVEVD